MTVDLDVVTRMATTYASHAYQARPRAEDLQPLGAVYVEVVAPLLAQARRAPTAAGDHQTEEALNRARREGGEQALAAVWRFVLDLRCHPGGCLRGELRNWLRARLQETTTGDRLALDVHQQRLDLIRRLTQEWEHPRVGHGACEYAQSLHEILDDSGLSHPP